MVVSDGRDHDKITGATASGDVNLAEKYVPEFTFREVHSLDVAVSSDKLMDAVAAYRPDNDRLFKVLIALRELPGRIFAGRSIAGNPNRAAFGLHNFTFLEFLTGHALAYGLVGRFWRPDFGLVPIPDSLAFLNFNQAGVPKLVLSFSALEVRSGKTLLTTETRVLCPDRSSRMKFAPYWYLIRPFSGLIRRRILRSIKTASERGLVLDAG